MIGLVFHDFAGNWWPWTDHAHVAAKDVEELRQFIQRVFTEQAPDFCDARIIRNLEQNTVALIHVHHIGAAFFRIANHGSEFEAPEDTTFFADAFRGVEDGSSG